MAVDGFAGNSIDAADVARPGKGSALECCPSLPVLDEFAVSLVDVTIADEPASAPPPPPPPLCAATPPPCVTGPKLSSTRVAELALLGACFLWGASFISCKAGLNDASPMVFTTLRFTLGSAILVPLYWKDLSRAHAKGAAVVGFLLWLGFALQTAGLYRTTAARNAFLTALCIPLTPLCECVLFWRRPRGSELASAAAALLGTFLLTRAPAGANPADADAAPGEPPAEAGSSFNAGDWLSLGCALVFALHVIALNKYSNNGEAAFKSIAVGQVAVTALLSALLCGVLEPPSLRVTPSLLFAVFFTGTLATALSMTIFTWAQKRLSASRSTIICATESLFAAVFSFLVFGERLGGVALVGASIIILSIVLGEVRLPPLPPPSWLPAGAHATWVRVFAQMPPQAAPDGHAKGAADEEEAEMPEINTKEGERVGLLSAGATD